jgi:hypothetical protein
LAGNPVETNHFEELGVDGRAILKWNLNKYVGLGVDRINLTQDR